MNLSPKTRGRPREFDLDTALDTGERMFRTFSFETVGIAALTAELGISPPSFYKAFGSKAAFFEAILLRYARRGIPLEDILLPGRPTYEALAHLLQSAARHYAKDPEARGCLVLEAARGNRTQEEVIIAHRVAEQRRKLLRNFIAKENPRAAGPLTDYIASTMAGLSASAREGMSTARLLAVARTAAGGIGELLDR